MNPRTNPIEGIENEQPGEPEQAPDTPLPGVSSIALFLYWSFSSLLAYTIAGEKMPWLTVHITLGMILSTAWFLGQVIESTDWTLIRQRRGFLVLLLLAVFLISTIATIGTLLGTTPPFQGKELHPAPGYQHILVRLDNRGILRLGVDKAHPRLESRAAHPPVHPGGIRTAGISNCQSSHHGCIH